MCRYFYKKYQMPSIDNMQGYGTMELNQTVAMSEMSCVLMEHVMINMQLFYFFKGSILDL